MAINMEGVGGDMNVRQNIEDSEIDSSMLDVSGKDIKGNASVDQSLKGVKSKKGWVMVALGLFAAAVSIAGYYFIRSPQEPIPEPEPIEILIDSTNQDSLIQDTI